MTVEWPWGHFPNNSMSTSLFQIESGVFSVES